jgi:hypothetical protein
MSAGSESMSGRDVEALLAQFDPVVAELSRRCIALLEDELPGVQRKVYASGWKNVQFRLGREILAVVNPLARYVNVNLGHATELSDPQHVLEGTGKDIRHVKVRPEQPFPETALRGLLRQQRDRFLR